MTTGEWSGALREVFGEYRAPTGVAGAAGEGYNTSRSARSASGFADRRRTRRQAEVPGRQARPGRALQRRRADRGPCRDAGFEVIYSGIRLTPSQIVSAAVEEDVHVVGLSVLSGSHLSVVPDVLTGLREAGLTDVPLVVGGIVPDADAVRLRELGVARVFTPKDFEMSRVLDQVVDAIREAHDLK